METLKNRIQKILKNPGVTTLASINEDGKPWARYVFIKSADDMTIRFATFMQARKVRQINRSPEVHLTCGAHSITNYSGYLQVQGKAKVSIDQSEKKALWTDEMKQYFSGPDDPNYGVVIIKPYRIEYWGSEMKPEIWEA